MDFYEKRDKVGDNATPYLKAILRNKIYDYYHKRKTAPFIPLGEEEHPDVTNTPSMMDGLYEKEMNKVLNEQIIMLPEQCRIVFLMSRNEDLSNKEIAARLGISVKTVEGHITKALKYLRERMDHHLVWCLGAGLLSKYIVLIYFMQMRRY